MPLSPEEQRELDELEFAKLNSEKTASQSPAITRRRALDINAPGRMDIERSLLRTEEGRKRLAEAEAEGAGLLAPRGNLGVLADIALESSGPIAGQALGAATGIPALIPVGGAVGGVAGNLASQKRRILAGEQAGYRAGEMMGSALSGAIPGAPLAAGAGRAAMAREVFKQAAGGGAAKTLETAVDEGRLPGTTELAITTALPAVGGVVAQRIQAANPDIIAAAANANAGIGATKRASFEAGKDAGYWVPPSEVTGSWFNKRLESLAGPADIRRGAALHNQEVTNRLAAVELGLPETTEITRPVLRAVRDEAAEPYRQLAALGAGGDVDALREAQFTRNENYKHYNSGSGGPDALRRARDAEVDIANLENRLEATALTLGRPELIDEMRAGRVLIAKSYDVERALNVGDAGVSAPILGRAIDSGKPLSGNLATIANFAEAFPRVIPEAARVHPFGLSKTEAITGSALAGLGFGSTHDPRTLALALVPPLLSSGARRTVLSRPYQALVANMPSPHVAGVQPDPRAMALRVLTQEAAQEIAEEAKPEKKPATKN